MDRANKLIALARKQIGKPYKYGAKLSEAPKMFDCSSFVQYIYKKIGIDLPRVALDQAGQGEVIDPLKEKLLAGDLFFIKGGWGHYNPDFPIGIGHVGVYIGGGKVISARWFKNVNGRVVEEPVSDYINRSDFVVAKRIIG